MWSLRRTNAAPNLIGTQPKWSRLDRLWPIVPWIWPSDFDDGPKALWEVEYAVNQDRASCWEIPLYEPSKSTRAFLMVHATRGNGNDGGEITLAISGSPRYDIFARESFTIAQRNPARCLTDDGA